MTLRIYLARGMTGRPKMEVLAEAMNDKLFLENAEFEVLCPVIREGIKNEPGNILASKQQIDAFWPEDKRMIRDSHILFHVSPHLNSAGAWQEVGYQRYHLQGPVVHIYPEGKLPSAGAIPRIENDYVCDSMIEAMEYALRVHGTFWKRTKWRLSKLNRCLLKSVFYQSKGWLK